MRITTGIALILTSFVAAGCGRTSDSANVGNANDDASTAARRAKSERLAQFRRDVASCVNEVSRHSPIEDAKSDIEKSEFRYFGSVVGDHMSEQALGLECAAMSMPRRGFFNKYDSVVDAGDAACIIAIDRYKTEYNRAMARMAPSSIQLNCTLAKPHKGKPKKLPH